MKNKKGNHESVFMPLDKKSNEDFNNQHPDHDENGLINTSTIADDKDAGNNNSQTSDMKTTETKIKINKK